MMMRHSGLLPSALGILLSLGALGPYARLASAATDARTCSVEGTVRDGSAGTPLAAVVVTLLRSDSDLPPDQATTNATGQFVFVDVACEGRGQFFLRATHPEYVPHLPAHYYGEVEREGDSGSGFALPTQLFASIADRDRILGAFSMRPGDIARSSIALQRGGSLHLNVQWAVPSGGSEPHAEGFFLYRDAGKISGLTASRPVRIAWFVPDHQGEVTARNLEPGAGYFVRIRPDGFASDWKEALEVHRGETRHKGILLDLPRESGISGSLHLSQQVVRDLTGTALVYRVAGSQRALQCQSRIVGGRFTCLGLGAGIP
jgi:hypothetical protein